jgi:hypothetical protein
MPLNDCLRAKLDVEVAVLVARTVRIVAADERALAAIGPDPSAASAALPTLDAGLAQARREAAALRSAWPVRTQPLAGTWTASAREPG